MQPRVFIGNPGMLQLLPHRSLSHIMHSYLQEQLQLLLDARAQLERAGNNFSSSLCHPTVASICGHY